MGRLGYATECEFEIDAAALWQVVRNFGDVSWLDDDASCELEGEGVGMLRKISMRGGEPACERLEEVDDAAQSIRYSIVAGNPMPITEYVATMKVVELTGDRARLDWSSTFGPAEGVADDKARRSVERLYTSVLATMKDKLESR